MEEQFIYDLPARLGKCIKSEAYADAVKFYTGAMPIFKVILSYYHLNVGSIFIILLFYLHSVCLSFLVELSTIRHMETPRFRIVSEHLKNLWP